MEKMIILCNSDLKETIMKTFQENGIFIDGLSDVPNDTTMEELQNAIVENRSVSIEEEYADAFSELA